MTTMLKQLRPALVIFAALSVLTGVVYPLAVTGIAHLWARDKAEGSLIRSGERVIGSRLIAQKFENPRYFWPRPSAVDYTPVPSGASNLGPTAKKLEEQRQAATKKVESTRPGAPIPPELAYASGSGLDPHLSPDAALYQTARIAAARNLPEYKVRDLVSTHIEQRQLRLLGHARVNVLELNLALDRLVNGARASARD